MKRIVKADIEENLPKEENLPESAQVIKRLQVFVEDMQGNVYDWQKYLAEAELEVREKGAHPANIAYYEKGLHFWEEQLDAAQRNLDRAMRFEHEELPEEEKFEEETAEYPMEPGAYKIKKENLVEVEAYRKELLNDLKGRINKEVGTTDFAKLEEDPEKFLTLAVYNSIGVFIAAHESSPPEQIERGDPTAYDYKNFLESELSRRLDGYEALVQQFSDEKDPAHGEAESAAIAYKVTKGFLEYLKERKGGN